jgi:hypothetical protein
LRTDLHNDAAASVPEPWVRRRACPFFATFGATVALFLSLVAWWLYSPGQDHIASISLNGDGSWYHNYEVGFEIQDQEILYHNIGASISNARKADIIFLGWSKLIFGLDWRLFESFEQPHQLKMFNMGLAAISSGEFSLQIIRKWGLHPKMWVINADLDYRDIRASFFFNELSPAAFGTGAPARVVNYSRLRALKNVLGRNIRWRIKMARGVLPEYDSYRSAKTGNWWLDKWVNHHSASNPPIRPMKLVFAAGKPKMVERDDPSCPALPAEIGAAKRYLEAIGGTTVLIQVPSALACAQRVHELASAIGVSSFTVDPTLFTSNDGGGHLDAVSARKYSTMLFAWLEQLPEFRELFPAPDKATIPPPADMSAPSAGCNLVLNDDPCSARD